MRILLPPSEGKAVPRGRRRLDLGSLTFPELAPPRERVINALIELARGPEGTAQRVLGISARQIAELERDRTLPDQPVGPARTVYAGVLYEALDLASLPTDAARRANSSLLISSALLGIVRPGDRIPAYRLSGDTDLPGLGSLASVWREPLEEALSRHLARGLIIDLRSGAYAAHWTPRGAVAARTVTVRVLQERRTGRTIERVVVSHHNKATKGQLVRSLLMAGANPTTPDDFVTTCRDLGYRAEPAADVRGIAVVDVILDA